MYFFAQLSNYSVRCGAEFPADICSALALKHFIFKSSLMEDNTTFIYPETCYQSFSQKQAHSLSHHHHHHPLFDTHPPAETTVIMMHLQHHHPQEDRTPPGFSLRSWNIYLPKLRTVFNFKITCYESSTLDFVAPFRCLNAWRHITLENQFWCLRVPKSIARGEASPPFPALPSRTAGGNLDWVPDLEGPF